ncbi:MAG: hypothetical protein KGL39_58070 [Patescibacteria group bacterium]|nr:hypothetical protein [Patescibacteria group bacterium]
MGTVVTAADAAQYIAGMNSRKRSPGITDDVKNALPPVFIFNIFNREHRVHLGTYGEFFIPACPDGQPFAGPVSYDTRGQGREAKHCDYIPGFLPCDYDQGSENGQLGLMWERGDVVAKDVVGIGSGNPGLGLYTTNREWWGVFISETATVEDPKPSAAELAEARKKLLANMDVWFKDGLRLAQDGKFSQIGANHRIAAKFLNQRVEWAADVVPMENCPVCQEPIKPGTIKHPCGAILDAAKALKHGVISREQYEDMTASAAPKPIAGPKPGQPIRQS